MGALVSHLRKAWRSLKGSTSMQVCGNAKLPLPAAQFESGDGGGQLMLGEGEFAMHLAQLNPVIYV
jgi:hypothetical protein